MWQQDFEGKLGGSQGKIYSRSVQKVLPINPITQQIVSQRIEKYIMCDVGIPIRDLRVHLSACSLKISADGSRPDNLPPVFHDEDLIPGIF